MGRRALRKVNPALDLSRHLRRVEDLPPETRPASWFPQPAPLEIEIGSGKGLFLAGAAAANPAHHFVGVELAKKYAHFAAARLARLQLDNACMVEGDGLSFVREFVPDASVHAMHVYFPDPWWKKRHRKRRVLNTEFLKDIQRVLVPEGRLHFWTDVEEYFQSTLELIAAETQLVGPFAVPERPAEHDLDYRTHFERRTRKEAQPVYRAEFMRGSTPAAVHGQAVPPAAPSV